jgi:hypothetical protein
VKVSHLHLNQQRLTAHSAAAEYWDLGSGPTLILFRISDHVKAGAGSISCDRCNEIPYGHIWLGGPGRGQACDRGVLGEAIGRPVERRYSLTRRTFQIGA